MRKYAFLFLCIILGGYTLIWLLKKNVGDLRPALLPAININDRNAKTVPESGNFEKKVFADNLGGVRDLAFSRGGVLVASVPGSGKVVVLPDKNADRVVDSIIVLLSNLRKPHGLAFYSSGSGPVWLFVAEETQLVRYRWDENNLRAILDKKLFDLPKGGRHFTRTIAFDKKGNMFVSIGSTCDVCFEKQPWIGTVIVSNGEGEKPRVYAKGLRNSVFIKVNPETGELWGTEMGRDFLGDDLPPDEVNILRDGRDYGWPVCYGNRVYDAKFGQKDRSYCENTVAPVFNLPAHVAPLGLTFINSSQFPADWQGDLLVAFHGSWNSSVPVGYKIVRLDVDGDSVVKMEDFLTGFLQGNEVIGRPVDLEFGPDGSLYVSDDKAGVIYIVYKK